MRLLKIYHASSTKFYKDIYVCTYVYVYMYVSVYIYGLDEETWYGTQSFLVFKQSSGIHSIYLFS